MKYTTMHRNHTGRRSGIVLLVVMAMLALFSTVALSFVFYAEAEATAARYAAQAQTQSQADVDPELLLSYFLSQLIYDTDNPLSAMRGHSLARNMYGLNPADVNVVPYNGLGRMRFPVNLQGAPATNNALLINYQPFAPTLAMPNVLPLRNPETDATGKYVGGNVHWTYPDLNNFYLAAVNGDGDVLIPSFHRPWLGVNPANANDPWAKYKTVRPHISYHTTKMPDGSIVQFNPPDWDGGGDVKNLEWGLGLRNGVGGHFNNDSIWMDLGFPVLTAPNGKRYKVLFAPLIVDLDSKANLFVHGNIMNAANAVNPHFSHVGYGWWEVNVSKVLNADPTEWQKLFQNSAIAKYGLNGVPDVGTVPGPLNPNAPDPPYWSKTNFGKVIGLPPYYPGAPLPNTSIYGNPNNSLQTFPDYPLTGWDNGKAPENINHAAGYNPFANGATDDKVALVLSHIEALYRFMGTGSPALTSDLLANLPNNMQNPKTRWLSTLRSMDLDRPGLMPFNWQNIATLNQNPTQLDPTLLINYKYNSNPPPQLPPGQPGQVPFPPNPAPGKVIGGEFNATGSRSNVFSNSLQLPAAGSTQASKTFARTFQPQLRVLLNRSLSPYPLVDPTTGLFRPADAGLVDKAVNERTNLAFDLLTLLLKLTGLPDPRYTPSVRDGTGIQGFPAMITDEYQATRWLAQLALNIVDFIDEDDYMTPWQWNGNTNNPHEWLFGTELGHLVINEVYAQVDNDVQDNTLYDKNGALLKTPKASNYCVNFWLELHNPFKDPTKGTGVYSPGTMYPRDFGKAIIQNQNKTAAQNNYQIVVTSREVTSIPSPGITPPPTPRPRMGRGASGVFLIRPNCRRPRCGRRLPRRGSWTLPLPTWMFPVRPLRIPRANPFPRVFWSSARPPPRKIPRIRDFWRIEIQTSNPRFPSFFCLRAVTRRIKLRITLNYPGSGRPSPRRRGWPSQRCLWGLSPAPGQSESSL